MVVRASRQPRYRRLRTETLVAVFAASVFVVPTAPSAQSTAGVIGSASTLDRPEASTPSHRNARRAPLKQPPAAMPKSRFMAPDMLSAARKAAKASSPKTRKATAAQETRTSVRSTSVARTDSPSVKPPPRVVPPAPLMAPQAPRIAKPTRPPRRLTEAARPTAPAPTGPSSVATPEPSKPAKANREKTDAGMASATPDRIAPSVAPPPPPPDLSEGRDPTAKEQLASLPAAEPADASVLATGDSYRIPFTGDASELGDGINSLLDKLAHRMQRDPSLRIQVLGFSSARDSASQARRISLFRALSVRTYLMKKGIRSSRMDVRALGDKNDGATPDRVDIQVKK